MIIPRGQINSPFWVVVKTPSDNDNGAGTLITGSEGYHFDKLIHEIGLPEPYITSIEQNTLVTYESTRSSLDSFLLWLSNSTCNKPSLVALYDKEAAELITPETRNYKKPYDCKLDKWAGSLLVSPLLQWPHYCIPLWPVTQFFIDWSYRDIYKFIDLGHIKEEYDDLSTNGCLTPLPVYSITTNPTFSQILDWFSYCRTSKWIAADIETIRPPRHSKTAQRDQMAGHMYTISLAPNAREALGFQLWNWPRQQRAKIWMELNALLKNSSVIGQNYFQFDSHYEEAYGLEVNFEQLHDTRIRHHLLWPELPHSLQFQTKQYTRQKYYKDEGKNWKPSQLTQLLNYNCLDTLVDYKIFEEQEKEFDERNHLR